MEEFFINQNSNLNTLKRLKRFALESNILFFFLSILCFYFDYIIILIILIAIMLINVFFLFLNPHKIIYLESIFKFVGFIISKITNPLILTIIYFSLMPPVYLFFLIYAFFQKKTSSNWVDKSNEIEFKEPY